MFALLAIKPRTTRMCIYSEWLDRIKPTPDKMKEFFLECEYHLVLSVGNVEESGSELKSFGGLKWPE